jgi:hypothetical protein
MLDQSEYFLFGFFWDEGDRKEEDVLRLRLRLPPSLSLPTSLKLRRTGWRTPANDMRVQAGRRTPANDLRVQARRRDRLFLNCPEKGV